MNALIRKMTAAAAAVMTTFALFSAVASLADSDRSAVVAANAMRGAAVASTGAAVR